MAIEERRATARPDRRLEGWTVLHGPRVAELPGAAAECIVVGPGGFVVVVSVTGEGRHGARDVARGAAEVLRATSVVTSLVSPEHRTLVRPVVAIGVADPSLRTLSGAVGTGVSVTGTSELADLLESLPVRLSAVDVAIAADRLVRALVVRPTGPLLSTADLPRSLRGAPEAGPATGGPATGRPSTDGSTDASDPAPESAATPRSAHRLMRAGRTADAHRSARSPRGIVARLLTAGLVAATVGLVSYGLQHQPADAPVTSQVTQDPTGR